VDAAEALALLLRMQGHIARVAVSAAVALSWFDDFKPDFCFIEIAMPDMDGYQLARLLRTRPGGRRCQFVALAGSGSVEDIRASLAAGFDHHVVNPVSIKHMSKLFSERSRTEKG
jgi:CheY-like chemotaxis protein